MCNVRYEGPFFIILPLEGKRVRRSEEERQQTNQKALQRQCPFPEGVIMCLVVAGLVFVWFFGKNFVESYSIIICDGTLQASVVQL